MKVKSSPFIVISGAVLLCYILSDFEQFAFMKPYMETTMLVALLVIFIVGWIKGIMDLHLHRETDGVIQIDTSSDEKDIYRLVYNDDPAKMIGQDFVTFKVEKTRLD